MVRDEETLAPVVIDVDRAIERDGTPSARRRL
jgi:hypothetical protein